MPPLPHRHPSKFVQITVSPIGLNSGEEISARCPQSLTLIKKVWEADPLLCPRCSHEMRIVALIDERGGIERILRHLGLWEPDYDTEPVMAYANG